MWVGLNEQSSDNPASFLSFDRLGSNLTPLTQKLDGVFVRKAEFDGEAIHLGLLQLVKCFTPPVRFFPGPREVRAKVGSLTDSLALVNRNTISELGEVLLRA